VIGLLSRGFVLVLVLALQCSVTKVSCVNDRFQFLVAHNLHYLIQWAAKMDEYKLLFCVVDYNIDSKNMF
jgi:hypothetical protein